MTGHAPLAEQDLYDHPDDDDEEAQFQKEDDGARPGRSTATGRHDEAHHRPDEQEEKRVRRPHGADGQRRRPDPPGKRMEGPATPGGALLHDLIASRHSLLTTHYSLLTLHRPLAPAEVGDCAQDHDDGRNQGNREYRAAAATTGGARECSGSGPSAVRLGVGR